MFSFGLNPFSHHENGFVIVFFLQYLQYRLSASLNFFCYTLINLKRCAYKQVGCHKVKDGQLNVGIV